MIEYSSDINKVKEEMLKGFFQGWKVPYSSSKHLKILKNSGYFIVAIDTSSEKVIGFITAITDHESAAFIPLLEVLPEYKSKGIGSALVEKMLEKLKHITNIDLMCDPPLQKFYKKFGMIPSTGMVLRKYLDEK